MTTLLFNIHNAVFFPLSMMIMAMDIFYSGIVQIMAGLFEFRKGNTFGITAFIFLWLLLVNISRYLRMT